MCIYKYKINMHILLDIYYEKFILRFCFILLQFGDFSVFFLSIINYLSIYSNVYEGIQVRNANVHQMMTQDEAKIK